ncbi:MAG: hypothetical protein VZS44_10640 [Bacilli bacterium]|nr:hypothetical protein [Bacilli bacterium]
MNRRYNYKFAYYYENSRGRKLHIAEDEQGKSKVYHIIGFSEDIERQLYDAIEQYVESRLFDNFDMSIIDKN